MRPPAARTAGNAPPLGARPTPSPVLSKALRLGHQLARRGCRLPWTQQQWAGAWLIRMRGPVCSTDHDHPANGYLHMGLRQAPDVKSAVPPDTCI